VDWKKEEILAHAMVLSQREIIITKRWGGLHWNYIYSCKSVIAMHVTCDIPQSWLSPVRKSRK
jgi:hypothetical protein